MTIEPALERIARQGRSARSYPENMPLIVSPGPMKKRLKGPVVRLGADVRSDDATAQTHRRSAIVEPKTSTIFGPALDDHDAEEHRRRGDLADELFREIVRRAALSPKKKEP